MRANPYTGTDAVDETYMGDNFVRNTGDAVRFDDVNKFAWQSRQINGAKSDGIHLQSNPTMTELAFKEFNSKKDSVQNKFKNNLTERYGDQNHVKQDDVKLIYGQSEQYREYGADGRITKGQPELIPCSKYEEDKHPGNHTSIWGSYYDIKTGKWGYSCCQCVTFNAYCTGDDGINANRNSDKYRDKRMDKNKEKVNNIGVIPKPKELENADKLVNPSGYISTRGIMAAKGIARKVQKQQELEQKKSRKMKKREKKKKKKLAKREARKKRDLNMNQDDDDGYGADEGEREESNEPAKKRLKLSSDDTE